MPLEDENNEQVTGGKKASSGSKIMMMSAVIFLLMVVMALSFALWTTTTVLEKKEEISVNEITPDYAKIVNNIKEYEVASRKSLHDKLKKKNKEKSEEDELFGDNEESYGAFYPLDDFIVNLKDNGFLRVQVFVEFNSRDVPSSFISRIVPIRDEIIEVLSGRDGAKLKTVTGRDILRNDIIEKINLILGRSSSMVKNVYFTNFVVRN